MPSPLILSGYTITSDPTFIDTIFKNPPELVKQFGDLYLQSQSKTDKNIIKRLTDLIVKYPGSPQLKNFLSAAYGNKGNFDKAYEINHEIVKKHPDYLFGKLNLVAEYIKKNKLEKVPGVLGEAMEIKQLYPDRKVFHIAEVTGFYKVAILYYVKIKAFDLAENRLEILNDIAPGHEDTFTATSYLLPYKFEKELAQLKKDKEEKRKANGSAINSSLKIIEAPVFNHAAINDLYQYGYDIPSDKLEAIVALPVETLTQDLEKVLDDAIYRDDYLNEEWVSEIYSFPLHAICILGEIKSEKSLPVILNFLEKEDDFLEFWLADFMEHSLWIPLFLLSQNNLLLLEQFLLKPNIPSFAKYAVWKTLCQLFLHHPNKREEITAIFKNVLNHLNKATTVSFTDKEFLSLGIEHLLDCKLLELLPLIEELYQKKYVDTNLTFTYKELEAEMNDVKEVDAKEEIENIFELYTRLKEEETGDYLNGNSETILDDDIFGPVNIASSTKIGRNEPCPCGSGKKYKKCCLLDE